MAKISTPRVCKLAWHASVGYAKRIQELRSWATSQKALHKYDANYCIIFMQRYRRGHNGADSKETRFRHYFGSRVPCKLSLFRDFKWGFFEGWLTVFYQISVKFNMFFIRRGIEAVITGLTRNFVVTLEPPTLNPLIYKGFPQFK